VVLDKKYYSGTKPFALLVKKVNKEKYKYGGEYDEKDYGEIIHIYHRLGLVELGRELESVGYNADGKILIGNLPNLQSQIEIPPKQ